MKFQHSVIVSSILALSASSAALSRGSSGNLAVKRAASGNLKRAGHLDEEHHTLVLQVGPASMRTERRLLFAILCSGPLNLGFL